MLPEEERAVFDDIVARMGPLRSETAHEYLMPWWMPPALLMFYGVLVTVAAVLYGINVGAVLGLMLQVASGSWAWHRWNRRPAESAHLSTATPFIS